MLVDGRRRRRAGGSQSAYIIPNLFRAAGQQGLNAEPATFGAGQPQGIAPGAYALNAHGPASAKDLGNMRLRHPHALGKGGLGELAFGEEGCDVGSER